jgi:tetratricopeptide (TPR) repeat protein
VLLAICLTYANSFGNGFHFDDYHTINDNPAVRSLANVPKFFTDTTTFSVLPANRTYRPMVTTSLAFDYAMGHGYVPLWFHASTFVLFLLLVALLAEWYAVIFVAAESPGLKPGSLQASNAEAKAPAYLEAKTTIYLGLVGAAWFGLHPAIAETVNYIIQRGDIYCTLGCVGALVMFALWPQRRIWGLYLLPVVFAMLSKPPAAVFPLLLLGYVWFFEFAELPVGARLKKSAVAAVPSALVVAVMLWVQSAMTPESFAPSILSPHDYRLVQPYVWLRYFGALFLPLHLNVDTDLNSIANVFDPRAMVGLVFVALLLVAIWFTSRQRRMYPIAYGLIWFVVTELPTSLYPLSEVENDHRMFFAFVGLIAAVVWVVWLAVEAFPTSLLQARWFRPAGVALVMLTLSGYAWGVHVRNRVWFDEESLWLDDVQKSPENGRGLMIYGLTQMNKGAYPAALDYFTRALKYTPNYPTLEINLGVVNGAMADQGDPSRVAEAEAHFQRAIALAENDDAPHAFYGRWLIAHGRLNDGIVQEKTAVELNPSRTMQREQLIQAYSRLGDAADAKQSAIETLQVAPDDAVAQQTLLHPPAAQPQVAASPDVSALINESLQLNLAGKIEESLAVATKAAELNPQAAEAWNNIAADNEALHRWDPAIAAAKKAIALRPDFQLAKNNLAWSISQKQQGVK